MAHSEVPAPPSTERRRGSGGVIVGSLLALAAAVSLYVSVGHRAAPEARVSASAEAPANVVQGDPEAKPDPKTHGASALTPAASANQLVARVDELPIAPPEQPSPASAPATKEKILAFHVKKESAPNAGKLVLEEQSAAAQSDVPPIAAAPKPVAASVQAASSERPGTGAVQAALGSVRTSARGCLAGQDTGARALVMFEGRTGHVKSVKVVGAEPGSPAESCVRAALMGARLPPFSDPDFTASITVRPL
jgi:hypothetical protein